MARRSPARWMAPLALVAAVAAAAIVVSATTSNDAQPSATPSQGTGTSTQRTPATSRTSTVKASPSAPARYTVKAGDTLGSIAGRTGVTVEQLQTLNPGLDPQSLRVGQSIKLR